MNPNWRFGAGWVKTLLLVLPALFISIFFIQKQAQPWNHVNPNWRFAAGWVKAKITNCGNCIDEKSRGTGDQEHGVDKKKAVQSRLMVSVSIPNRAMVGFVQRHFSFKCAVEYSRDHKAASNPWRILDPPRSSGRRRSMQLIGVVGLAVEIKHLPFGKVLAVEIRKNMVTFHGQKLLSRLSS